jgi:DNA replication factor GINS
LDEFFQKLREIQKKERNLSGLAPVGENFYHNISRYLNVLMRKIDDNPFSFESYLLRDAQRITAEICERREHKISNSAVMSVQRTYQLFKESESDSPTPPKIPRNSTPEEEKLFHALVDSLTIYREKMRGPLRFQNSQAKDRGSNIPDVDKENVGKETGVKAPGDGHGVDTSDIEVGPPDTGLDKSIKDDGIGFSPEEEAAIEDDIYKQFGKESFPGDNIGRSGDNSPKDGKPHSKDEKSPSKEEKSPSEDSNLPPKENKPSTQDVNPSSKEIKDSPEDKNPSNSLKEETAKIKQQDNQNIKTDVLMVLEELPSIMGVDKQVYGPLMPQDIVTIPEPNARILIKNQKGKSIQNYK